MGNYKYCNRDNHPNEIAVNERLAAMNKLCI